MKPSLRPRHLAGPVAVATLLSPLVVGTFSDAASEKVVNTAYLTAYTWYDNTPAGSAEIANPVVHSKAGGKGTYADPITVAVGIAKGTWDYPAGTRFYIPSVRRYFVAEDQCGTTASDPCHNLAKAASGATTWIDLWIGGRGGSESAVSACANKLTDLHRIVVNPASNYVVASGSGVFHDGTCDVGYGETLTKTSGVQDASALAATTPVASPTPSATDSSSTDSADSSDDDSTQASSDSAKKKRSNTHAARAERHRHHHGADTARSEESDDQ